MRLGWLLKLFNSESKPRPGKAPVSDIIKFAERGQIDKIRDYFAAGGTWNPKARSRDYKYSEFQALIHAFKGAGLDLFLEHEGTFDSKHRDLYGQSEQISAFIHLPFESIQKAWEYGMPYDPYQKLYNGMNAIDVLIQRIRDSDEGMRLIERKIDSSAQIALRRRERRAMAANSNKNQMGEGAAPDTSMSAGPL